MQRSDQGRRRLVRGAMLLLAMGGFFAVVVHRSFLLPRVRCELCLNYRGQFVCRTVEAADAAEARSAALTTACAVLASGVTETMACERTLPESFSCQPLP